MKAILNSIILFVGDTDKLKDFYVSIFGFEVMEEIPGQWVLLNAGACTIGLHKVGKEYEPPAGTEFKAESNTKIVLETSGGISGLREILLEKNISIGEIKSFDNYDYLICDGEDPEGNVFQLKQKK